MCRALPSSYDGRNLTGKPCEVVSLPRPCRGSEEMLLPADIEAQRIDVIMQKAPLMAK